MGKLIGGVIGFLGGTFGIGGIGIAALGTAIGIPAVGVGLILGAVGATMGSLFDR